MVKKMLDIIVITVSFTVLLFTNIGQANPLPVDIIDMGSIAAPEETYREIPYYLQLKGEPTVLELWLENDFLKEKSSLIIPGKRLGIKVEGEYQNLCSTPVIFPIENKTDDNYVNKEGLFLINMRIRITPEDNSGSYGSTLHIRVREEKGREEPEEKEELYELLTEVKFTVKPWLIIESQTPDITLSRLGEDFSLSNPDLSVLRIAANVPWALYSSIANADSLFSVLPVPVLHIIEDSHTVYSIINEYLPLKNSPVMAAYGPPTVQENNYWAEVPFILEVTDCREFPGGVFNFDVYFFVQPLIEE